MNHERKLQVQARLDHLLRMKAQQKEEESTVLTPCSRSRSFKPAQVHVWSLPYVQEITVHPHLETTTIMKESNKPLLMCCLHPTLPLQSSVASEALCAAALHGHSVCFQRWMECGTILDCVDASKFKRTPLFLAAASGHETIVEYLFKRHPIMAKTLVTRPDARGDTPLHAACYAGQLQIIQRLLEHGADPNAINTKGHTPAHLCCNDAGLAALMKSGGNLTLLDKRQRSPLFHASAQHRVECVSFLCTQTGTITIHTCDINGDQPLHAAVSSITKTATATIQVLLSFGADPCRRNKEGYLPSDIADFYSTRESAMLLREGEKNTSVSMKSRFPSIDPNFHPDRARLHELARSLHLARDYARLADTYDQERPYRDFTAKTLRCLICEHNTVDMVCMPCEHKCICNDCILLHQVGKEGTSQGQPESISRIKKCPLCRQTIAKVVSVNSTEDLSRARWFGTASILPSCFIAHFRSNKTIPSLTTLPNI